MSSRASKFIDDYTKVEEVLDALRNRYPDNKKITDAYRSLVEMFFFATEVSNAFESKKAEYRMLYKLWHDTRFELEELKIEKFNVLPKFENKAEKVMKDFVDELWDKATPKE